MNYPLRKKKAPAAKKARKPVPTIPLPEGGVYQSVGALMSTGMDVRIAEERHQTRDDAGRLRGGSSGAVLADYESYVGQCVRASAARFLGATPPRQMDKWKSIRLMFDGGHMSEDYFYADLVRGLPPGASIKREEEFPIVDTVLGEKLTGREDIIIVDAAGSPQCLVELKNVSSLPTDLLFGGEPKIEHLIQIGNYTRILSEQTGRAVPGQLWYTSRILHSLPTQWAWVRDALPDYKDVGALGHAQMEWSEARYGKPPLPTKLRPFYIGFHVRWHAGKLYYSLASERDATSRPAQWVETPILADGIVSYYQAVVDCARGDSGLLPDKPLTMTATGKNKGYDPCKYCDWNPVCSSVGDSYGQWRDSIVNHIEPAPASGNQGDKK